MPVPGSPADAANRARESLRQLAHDTRSIEDPRDIYAILGSLTGAMASLSQSLHQLAANHDTVPGRSKWVPTATRDSRAAAYQVSWDLHRAGEMLRQVGAAIGHAHEVESTIAYQPRLLEASTSGVRTADHGLER